MDESPSRRAYRARQILDGRFLDPVAAVRAIRLGWSVRHHDRRTAAVIITNALSFIVLWVMGALGAIAVGLLGIW